MTLLTEADVYRGHELAASLQRTAHGSELRYREEYLQQHRDDPHAALAFHLPCQRTPHITRGVNLHTFFAGLLPEGVRMNALVRAVKTSEDDLLSLLLVVGGDCVGDVSVVSAGEQPRDAAPLADFRRPEQLDFEELFEKSIDYRSGLGDRGSIPGVQRKVSDAMISVPVRGKGRGERYILKLDPPTMPGLVRNEAFFMKMAGKCGIAAAEVKLISDAAGRPGLLVRRFDRIRDPAGGAPRKLHQEDACQLLDRYPADKYNLTIGEVATALGQVASAGRVEILRLLRLHAFNYLIANGDLHAKNISVQRLVSGEVRLTPAYDLLSTLPYGDQHMALELDGRDQRLRGRYFAEFGERHGVRAVATDSMLKTLVQRVRPWLDGLADSGLEDRAQKHLEQTMRQRAEELLG